MSDIPANLVVAAAPAAAAAAEKKKRGPKPKTKPAAAAVPITDADEAALLAPVDDAIAPALPAPAAPAEDDPLRTHASRVKTIDPARCVARTLGDELSGTKPGDEGANGKFYYEKQCARKPVPGSELCLACAEKEKKYNDAKEGRWYGRLNQPMFDKAYVVGCAWFWKKYPNGIPTDPTTRPTHAPAHVPVPVAVPVPAPEAPKQKKATKKPAAAEPAVAPTAVPVAEEAPKKRRGRPPKATKAEPEPQPVPVAPAPGQEAIMDDSVSPVAPAWMYFAFNGTMYARNPINHNVYYLDMSIRDPEKQIRRDRFVGRWQPETSTVDRYATEAENEEDE